METLGQLNFARIYTQGRLQSVKDEQWDIQPEGFHNTIRWNVGHIFVSMESLIHRGVPEYEVAHPEWMSLFAPGTKPSDWTVAPPTNEELLTALAAQPARVKEFLTGKLDQQMPDVMSIGKFHDMATVEAVIQFAIWHEGIHAGIIFALNKVTAISE
ncbi:DinB family protein [Paenisporosarcina sp. NPDC076898]|uniref:DinB family protein n=1 Tax=unclassified Paenisporosarcina TaxID=2642018 RepID=UPI003CFE0891